MILTCPACATRYQADEAKFPPLGRQVRCAKCGHVWHQPGPVAAPESDAAPDPGPSPTAEPFASPARAFVPSVAVPEEQGEPLARGAMLAVVVGWIGLIALIAAIGYAAMRYRQEIAVVWPQSAGVYSAMGIKLNPQGIDFTKVDYRRENEDGQVVLVVTGNIVNGSSREWSVPQNVRVTLSDDKNHEIYHWNFTPNVQTLKSGQSSPFLTRLSAPPAAARHLEVRFTPHD
jgi:predicted Zn finger-like uncharacterized protein